MRTQTNHAIRGANRGQTANFQQKAPEIHVSPQFAGRADYDRLMKFLALLLLLTDQSLFPQQSFASRCAACHGEDARGTAKGPGLAMNPRVAEQSAEQLRAYLERGNTGAGMPSFAALPPDDLA